MKFCFGDIVVVDNNLIGVVVKSWETMNTSRPSYNYDVYVRSYNAIQNYHESDIERYMVRHKYLNREEMMYQAEATKIKTNDVEDKI